VPDGHTIVVGGLEVDSETEAVSRLPLLGRLPILGALFRNTSTGHTKSRFFVFLRCSVLQHERFEDLKYLSKDDIDAATLDDGLPVLEPRIMR
ncbi:MAG: type II and III secretion system protein, partial [bacterium]|nr:type II and III secretion system protein [bacterium]